MKIMHFKPLLLLMCLLFLGLSAFGQKATLKGKLTEAENSEGLPFANVVIEGTSNGTTTDMDGFYELPLDAGTYNIVYSYVGYDDLTKSVTVTAGEVKVMDITVGAQPELLEQVVVTANKAGTKVAESTISIAVVQPDLVENTNSTSIDQVVEKVPGVNIVDGQANIRGGSGYSYGAGSRVLLLVDDLPFLQGDAGFPNWRDIPVENINQIEVLKGAASALYGSSALNGIINVRTAYPTSDPVTKFTIFSTTYATPPLLDTCNNAAGCDPINRAWWGRNRDESPLASSDPLVAEAYMPIETGIQFAHRQKFGNFDLVLGGNLYLDNSFRKGEYNRKGRINANTRYRITDRFSVGVNANINAGNSRSFFLWENPYEGAFQPFTLGGSVNTTTKSKNIRYNIDPFLTYFDKFENRHKVLTRYYYVSNDNDNNQGNTSKLLYGEYQFQRSFEKLGNLGLVAGLVGTTTKSDSELFGNSKFNTSNIGAYFQVDKKFFEKLSVSAGMRVERNTINSPDSITVDITTKIENPSPQDKETKPVFRVGLNYQAAEYTFIRASWGQGYRYPTIAERYISTDVGPLAVRPNPSLQSETGWSSEIGISQGFQISSWQGFIDVSAFWTEYQDMMEFTFGGDNPMPGDLFFQSINVGDTRIPGAEISIMGKGDLFKVPTTLIAGYTYINPKFKYWETDTTGIANPSEQQLEGFRNFVNSSNPNNILKYRFKHTFKIDIQSTFFKKLDIGMSIQYATYMEAIDKFFEAVELFPGVELDLFGLKDYRSRNQNGTVLMDWRMAYHFSDNAKISFLVKNATNKTYTLRPALMEAPINFTVRGDFNF